MTSPAPRSVVVRLSMDTASYTAGAARAEASTLSLDKAVQKVGPSAATSMERAASGAGTAEGALGKLNKTAGALGFTLGGLAGIGGAVAVGMSIKWAADYQSALTRLVTTAGEAPANLKLVGQGMLDMAGQVGISAAELAKGMYTVDSAGIHGSDSLVVLKAAAQGAKQENADLSHVVDAVTTSLHDFHLPAADAATVTSQLIAAVSHGKTTFDELTGAMHSVEPIAASAGMSIAQTAGALAAMTASGMHADQAAQNLASSIRSFEKPTSTMTAELAQLGLSSMDLSAQLGQKGIAGTLQEVSNAIVAHMGPAGQVALSALNQNKQAAQALATMIATMPPALQQLSQGLLAGTTSQMDFRKASIDLGGQAGAMADQFLSLYKSSDGFSSILKAGGPAVQTYIGALGKAVGTSEGLSVALQLTGENADGANKAIGAVSKAAADAHGNVAGWDEVQATFNQRLAEAEQGVKSLAIEAGQHLLPVLTATFGWVAGTGVPAIQHLGSAIGDAVHWFSQLPDPAQRAAEAVALLGVASKTGLLGLGGTVLSNIASGFRAIGTAAGESTASLSTQQALFAMEQRDAQLGATANTEWALSMGGATAATDAQAASLSRAQMMMRDWDLALAGSQVLEDEQVASLGTMAGSLATVQATMGGLAARSSGALLSALVNPTTAAIAAVAGLAAGLPALVHWLGETNNVIPKVTVDTQGLTEAIKANNGAMDDNVRKQAAMALQGGGLFKAAEQWGVTTGLLTDAVMGNAGAMREVEAAAGRYKAGMEAAAGSSAAAKDQTGLAADAYKKAAMQSDSWMSALTGVDSTISTAVGSQNALKQAIGETNTAQQTQLTLTQNQTNANLAAIDATDALQLSQMHLQDAIEQYNKDATDGQHSTRQLAEEQLGLVDTVKQTAAAAQASAEATAKQNGVQDYATAGQVAYKQALEEAAKSLSGPAKDAVLKMIDAMGASTDTAHITAEAMQNLGLKVEDIPTSHQIVIDAPTADQEAKLAHLGYVTVHLPNGTVVVTADTNPAIDEINSLLQYARTQAILYRATLPSLVDNTVASGSGRPGLATGGWVRGPGTGTSDSVPIMGSNGEFMVRAAAARENAGLLEAINAGQIRGFAGGGWIGPPGNGSTAQVPVRIDPASVTAVNAALHGTYASAAASLTAPGAPGNVSANAALGQLMAARYGWGSGAEWNALYALWRRESGWNNLAQNPTSTAFGIPQFLNSTWASTGYPKSTDSATQIAAGLKYVDQRFHDPIGAWAHEVKFGWYHDGGTVTGGPDGATVPAFLKVGETVRTAEQEDQVQRVMRTREMTGSSFAPAVVHHTDARSYPVTFSGTGMNEEQLARKVRDGQRDVEFLHG